MVDKHDPMEGHDKGFCWTYVLNQLVDPTYDKYGKLGQY